jgi:hypothetical protein
MNTLNTKQKIIFGIVALGILSIFMPYHSYNLGFFGMKTMRGIDLNFTWFVVIAFVVIGIVNWYKGHPGITIGAAIFSLLTIAYGIPSNLTMFGREMQNTSHLTHVGVGMYLAMTCAAAVMVVTIYYIVNPEKENETNT